MDMQAEAERKKRAQILESEGSRESEINIAEGQRQSAILKANGEAQATLARARASSKGIELLADAIKKQGGTYAVSLRVAEQYVDAFSNLAKKSTTMILPSDSSNPSSFIASALGIYAAVTKKNLQFPAFEQSSGIMSSTNEGTKIEDNKDIPKYSLSNVLQDAQSSETKTEAEIQKEDEDFVNKVK